MGVLTGLAGTVMLVLKRKPAEPVLLLSLIATLIWLAGLFATPLLRQSMSTNDAAVALATVLISWTIYWFARHSRQRGWLR
jgi:positive regulator of sigma E activity